MAQLPSGLPDQVADEEDLARFLTQSSQYSKARVKPAAFLPNQEDRETSVCRHGPEPAQRLWEFGGTAAGNRKLHGAAIFKAKAVRDANLEVTPKEPPPRHAVIEGWPWIEDDLKLQKAKQKQLAIQLSEAAGEPILNQQGEAR